MTFKTGEFLAASFEPRTQDVSVPALSDFFDGEAVWKVRGLTAQELSQADRASDKQKNLAAAISIFGGEDVTEKLREIQRQAGLGPDVDPALAKRMEMLVTGSVDPEINLDVAIKVAQVSPIEFFLLTNTITELSGKGQTARVKPKPSGNQVN